MAGPKRRAHGEVMKSGKAFGAALVALFLASCMTVPPDGVAVECRACRAMWIRLFPPTEAPGIYRLKHCPKSRICPNCSNLAAKYFETGEMAPRCPSCRGDLVPRPVNVVR